MAYDGQRRRVLLAGAGTRVWRGTGVRSPAPRYLDGVHGPAGKVGTYTSTERPALGALNGVADRREWCHTGAKGWCHNGRWCCGRVGYFAILNRPRCGKLALIVVATGVGVLFGGHVVGEGGLCNMAQNRKTDLEVHPCLGLDLSCTQSPRAKWARSCSISFALEGCLRPTFTATLPTLSILGIDTLNAGCMQTGW